MRKMSLTRRSVAGVCLSVMLLPAGQALAQGNVIPPVVVAPSTPAVVVMTPSPAPTVMMTPGGTPVVVMAPSAPPLPPSEVMPAPPSGQEKILVWQPGRWTWAGSSWLWVTGMYVSRPEGKSTWAPGRWELHPNGSYVWAEGRWS